jgi:transposase-like protein
MAQLCYRRHRFPPEIIQHPIWQNLRFTLSYRDVEDLQAEEGSTSPTKRCGAGCGNRWHLEEMVVQIAGERTYL